MDQLAEQVGLAAAAMSPLYPVTILDASVVKVRDGAHGPDKATQIAVDLGKDVVGSNQVCPPSRRQPRPSLARGAGRTG